MEYQRCFPSLHDWWDVLKNSFKDILQDFGKQKQKELNHAKVTATNLLIQAKRDLLAGDDSAKIGIEYWERSLQALYSAQNETAKIRSRAQWLDEGEKLTKYFFTLESMRKDKNSIRVIYNSEGNEVVTQQEIETAHCDFYRKLYSCEPVDPQIQRDFLSKVDVSLNDQEINLLNVPYLRMRFPARFAGCRKGKHLAPMDYLWTFMLNFGISCALFYINSIISVLSRVPSVHRCKRVSLV